MSDKRAKGTKQPRTDEVREVQSPCRMNSHLIDTMQLSTITGYERCADITRCLRDQGIAFFHGKNGPWTTLDLINAAGGLKSTGVDGSLAPYDPDDLCLPAR